VKSSAGQIALAAGVCAAVAGGLLIAVCFEVTLLGLSDVARGTLRFGFAGVDQSPSEVLRLALYNIRFPAGILLCAAIVPQLSPRVRLVTSLLVTSVFVVNATVTGVALGAYGPRMAAALAPHLPVEAAALSLAGGTYIVALVRPACPRTLAWAGAVCALLVVSAAWIETYVRVGGPR
jgi:hypothetical protein